jgi:hypothetical protein
VEELGASGIILKHIINQQGRIAWNGFICLKHSSLWLNVVDIEMNLQVPKKARNFSGNRATRVALFHIVT